MVEWAITPYPGCSNFGPVYLGPDCRPRTAHASVSVACRDQGVVLLDPRRSLVCYNRLVRVTRRWAVVSERELLRKELAERAKRFATANGLAHYESVGRTAILFPAEPATTRHGNFNDESYAAIRANASWAKRLKKPHPQRDGLPKDRQASAMELMELDSSNSSDALLMNCFCYPGSAERILQGCLQVTPTGPVEFGVRGKVPLRNGKTDRTELDMRVGNIVCEAKLSEPNFTSQRATVVEAYRDLHEVFDGNLLPRVGGLYQSYQLIRNVLATAAHAYHFVLLCDGRRPDLLQEWRTVHAAIRHPDLRARAHLLLWQDVAKSCPATLREYLHEKYGL